MLEIIKYDNVIERLRALKTGEQLTVIVKGYTSKKDVEGLISDVVYPNVPGVVAGSRVQDKDIYALWVYQHNA